MPHAGSRHRRPARGYGGVACPGWASFGRAARVPREARLAMRLLHAGIHHGLGWAVAPKSVSQRGRNPCGAGQQHLPLHRIRQNHRGSEICRRPPRRRSVAVNEIVPARNIGGYVPMIDGPEKVSGRAKYTADLLSPGMLAGRIYRSPYSHAEIVDVDVSEAMLLPGVKAVVTAVDDATAKRAIGLIRLTVRELPAYFTAKEATARGAAELHAHRPNNIERDVAFELGSVD